MDNYRVFFDDVPIALICTDIETGKFLMANKFAAKLLGCKSVEELKSNRVATEYYIDPKQREDIIRQLRLHGSINEQEMQFRLPNGKDIWVRANFRADCTGTCMEGFLQDITELVLTKKKLLENLEKVSKDLNEQIRMFHERTSPSNKSPE